MKLSKATIEHLKNHIDFPAGRAQIVKACDNWADVPATEKGLVDKLPNRTFNNADEIIRWAAKL